LEYYYKDPKRWGYTFQSYAFYTRHKHFKHILKNIDASKNPLFIERSVFSDREIFARMNQRNKTFEEIEWAVYNQWFDYLIDIFEMDV
jgi:deoxyguanosine kinase